MIEKSVLGRSFCPNCNKNLGIFDLIPLFSYLFSRGKCRYCGVKISIFYPFIEIIMLIFGIISAVLSRNDFLLGVLIFTCCFACLVIGIVDFKQMWIPDSMNCVLLVCSILYFMIYQNEQTIFLQIFTALIMPIFKFGYEFLRSKIFKKEGEVLGFGDVKFLVAISAFFCIQDFVIIILLSAIFNVFCWIFCFTSQDKEMPFGPLLSSSFLGILFLNIALKQSAFDLIIDRTLLIFY